MNSLKDTHHGETAYIIGKGPSLKKLTPFDFGAGFLIVLYEALSKIRELKLPNTTYSMQKDEVRIEPRWDEILLLHSWESAKTKHPHQPQYIWNNNDLGLDEGNMNAGFSLQSAIRIAEFFGAKDITLYGFDAHTGGSMETMGDRDFEDHYRKQIRGMQNFEINVPHRYGSHL